MSLSDIFKNIFYKENKESKDEENLFVAPYDFYIEADNRFSDSKSVITENPCSINVVELLEGMELSDDVKNHSGVRRKLKRLYDNLSFEIGEYITYKDGRTVSGSVVEEIDEHELEIGVKISKKSDSNPFEAVISIKEN